MKFIPLHTRNTTIIYKNSLCSLASLLVLVFIALSVMLPVLLVSLLSPYSGISESRVLYEQPKVQFSYQYIFVGHTERPELESSLISCSTFANFNARMQNYSNSCLASKYWTQDLDHDTITDRLHFQLELQQLPTPLTNFDLLLFFEAQLSHKCILSPPAVLAHQLQLPAIGRLQNGRIQLKGELKLKQYIEFACPFPGRNYRTHFRPVQLDTNNTFADISQYKMESLLGQVKANPAYFQLAVQETYFKHSPPRLESGLTIDLEMDVLQIPARYHLSIWERLGQFWLYFASFFGISFYVMNKLKDFLFGRHIIRSWEIIPWKKLY